ncbi:SMP-30/gluconolactonase/LRE family protein [Aliiruegeria sabulilitoris]|uniref:SMP-30/gluconolactonase/LRE family protein n=1 Tax=Aliiruegeria sabulilitoris TaxID=1510458 RepID=UPI0008378568|nr:SMP-30/gluconolactonase/LRE family protein [Aliiruegeria sabulilitoris]NDR58866.1 SMP-30/gluconolactonase/LRE family protein [Pseudoruegeria sp. M32A2M]
MFLQHLEIIDPAFKQLLLMNTHLEKLWEGGRWLEGPAWFGGGRYLVFSDIPNCRMMRYDDTDGSVSEFRKPSNNSNGNTMDREGRLITCEHLGRRVVRTEHDGSLTVLADNYQGKRLNSPNDVIVDSRGVIWFTDPSYGIDWEYEGHVCEHEVGSNNLYRLDPADGVLQAIATDFVQPNGLAFSPDETILYVADTGATHVEDGPKHIRRFRVDGASLKGGEVLSECPVGLYDGFRIDTHGNIWTSTGEGVHCLTAEGELIGKIKLPAVVSNVCFGGPKRNRLFICATTSLYATFLNVSGAV